MKTIDTETDRIAYVKPAVAALNKYKGMNICLRDWRNAGLALDMEDLDVVDWLQKNVGPENTWQAAGYNGGRFAAHFHVSLPVFIFADAPEIDRNYGVDTSMPFDDRMVCKLGAYIYKCWRSWRDAYFPKVPIK